MDITYSYHVASTDTQVTWDEILNAEAGKTYSIEKKQQKKNRTYYNEPENLYSILPNLFIDIACSR